MSLRTKIFIQSLVLSVSMIALILGPPMIYVPRSHHRRIVMQYLNEVDIQVSEVQRLMLWDDRVAVTRLLKTVTEADNCVVYAFVERENLPYAWTFPGGVPRMLLGRPASPSPEEWRFKDENGASFQDIFIQVDNTEAALHIGLSIDEMDTDVTPLLVQITTFGAVTILLAILLSLLLARWTTREVSRATVTLRESEASLRSVFRAAPTGIGVIIDRVLKQANERMCEMTGYSEEELIDQNARMLYPSDEDYEYVGREKYAQIRDQGTGTVETRLKRKDGRIIDVLLSSTPIHRGDLSKGITFTVLDITERKRAEEQIQRDLKEKEILLKEVHHRVKNNLQIITSLIRMQSGKPQSDETRMALSDVLNRVGSIAAVHELLYQSDSLAAISAREYLSQLILRQISLVRSEGKSIKVEMNIEDIDLPMKTAVPFGLIVNELVTNTLKHAFDGEKSPQNTIMVELESGDNRCVQFTFRDNGKGLPDDFHIDKLDSLGFTLISGLTQQLDGELTLLEGDGAGFRIEFPNPSGG